MIQTRWSSFKCRIMDLKLSQWETRCFRIGIMTKSQIFRCQNQQIIFKIYKIFQMFQCRIMKIVSLCFRDSKPNNSNQKIIGCQINRQRWSLNNKFHSIHNNNNNINFLLIINNNSQCKSSMEWVIKWILIWEITIRCQLKLKISNLNIKAKHIKWIL